MAELTIGANFPAAKLQDIDGETVEFPKVFGQAPAAPWTARALWLWPRQL